MSRGLLGCLLGTLALVGAWSPPAFAQGEDAPPPPAATAGVEDPSTLTWEKAWDSGFAMYREGRYAEAIPYLERALELEPEDPTVRAYLAESYRQLGDDEAAARYMTPADEPDAGEPPAADADDTPAAGTDAGEDEPDAEPDAEDDEPPCVDEDGGCGAHPWTATRRGRHLGFGLALAGNALSVGVYVEALPVRFLALEGGWGVGDVRTMFWWAQAALQPFDAPLTPTFGVGALGNFGLDYRFQASMPAGYMEYYLGRVSPYVHLGMSYVSRHGFSFALDLNGVFTGDRALPVAPWVGLRVGFLI